MTLNPRIEIISTKNLVGMHQRMSLVKNEIPGLWKSFMSRRKEVLHVVNAEFYSVEVYDDLSYFDIFNPSREFNKWAAVEVSSAVDIPDNMDSLIIPAGTYAVFTFKGSGQDIFSFYGAIFNEWLPSSKYVLDNRPHFACMGEKYRNGDPGSEEEIFIPVTVRDVC